MAICRTALLPLRVMLFSFYGGISCVLPFVTLHMSTLGLTADELSWLQFVLPFVGCAGPLLGGALADRWGNYRPLLVASLLVCAAAYPCLMLVPAVREPASRPSPTLSFHCNDEGSAVASEWCGAACQPGDDVLRVYYLERCSFECDPGVTLPSGLPHLCLEADNSTFCEVVADVGDGLVVNASLPRVLPRPELRQCWYPLVDLMSRGERYRGLACRSPPGCGVRCQPRQLTAQDLLFTGERCAEDLGDRRLTFWLYFGLRALTELCLPLALVLINATVLLLRRRHDSDFGWEFVWGLLGLMTFRAILRLSDRLLPVQPPPTPGGRSYSRLLAKSLGNLEFFSVLCVLLLLGSLWGFLEAFLYAHLQSLGGTQLQNGLSLVAGALLLVPFLLKAEPLINYCGHHHIFIIAFILYIVRYVSYAYIIAPWLALVAESLEMFTLHLAWMAAVLFTSGQSSPAIEATTQAVITVCHYGIGRGLGAGVVRYLLPLTSGFLLLCAGSVLAAASSVLYMLIYYCCRTLPPRRHSYGRHKREMYSSSGAMLNGTYAPLKQRHNGV
ncbi:uncharacterized protein LOC119107956 [Pollicipes pollicipes]|uniref:uncharacterized protein LOC119107956 n=1 Tax=Pollicipes pollicipes TaxID=41117 RepID=UPI0018850384|nr:uncharacterized protein LOC119107956 [Pollicipes pollicipes]